MSGTAAAGGASARGGRATFDPYAAAVDHGPVRFLHRLNPLAKIGGPLPAMIVLIVVRGVEIPLLLCAVTLVLILVGAHLTRRALLGLLVVLPIAVAVLSVSFGLWADPAAAAAAAAASGGGAGTAILIQVGDYRFTTGALLVGAATALRLAGILLLSLLAGLTSTGPDLVRALVQQLHVPYRVGYTALAAYRFVPRFRHELDIIRQAHRVRGVAPGRGPIAALRRGLGSVVPLLAGALRHADRMALAMDSRAFGASRTRTERHLVPFRARDWLFMTLFWTLTAALVVIGASVADPRL